MRIEREDIKRALAAPDYDPSRVIVIVNVPALNHWDCVYMQPLQAMAAIDEIAGMGDQVGSDPPDRWGGALARILGKQETAVVKFWGDGDRRYRIMLQGYDSVRLQKMRAIIAPS